MIRMKALCRICHDGYADENFCFGRCCGCRMMEVPQEDYDKIRYDKEAINKLIVEKGKYLGTQQ